MFHSTLYMALTTIAERCFVCSGVPRTVFSIGRFKEGAVCIERNFKRGETVVYDAINGKQQNVSSYNSSVLAVSEFIDRVYVKKKKASV